MRTVAAGALFSALCLLVIGFNSVFAIVAAVIVMRACLYNLTLPLYRAFVIDNASPSEYTVVNLILSSSANIGPTVGPTVSGWVQDRAGFGPLFIAAATLYGIAGLLYTTLAKPSRISS